MIAVAVVLGLAGAGLALRLRPTAATSTFVSSSNPEYRATQSFYRSFGEEPIAVLVRGSLQQLVLSSDIERLVGLEGCLSGNVPTAALAAEGGPHGPCAALARAKTVKVVFGPGTFISESAEQIDEQLTMQTHQAEAQAKQAETAVTRAALARGRTATQARELGREASKVTIGRFQESLVTLALKYGLTERPSIADGKFVSDLVFDSSKPAGTPKQRFAYLFPSRQAALISVRMRSGLSEAQRTATIADIRQAIAMPQWHLQHGESYLLTGEPVIVAELTSSITHSIELLLIAVLLVMAATLGLIFLGRPRLLPLALALLAAAITFGALSLVGASLTMASVAVLPVLVGLAVDYSIQFQSRVGETLEQDLSRDGERRVGVVRAAAAGAPTIATAGAASAAAMLVLALSPVPMVRGFGVLLVVGVIDRAPVRGDGGRGGAHPRPPPRGGERPECTRAGCSGLSLAGRPRAAHRQPAHSPAHADRPGGSGAPSGTSARHRPGAGGARMGSGYPDEGGDRHHEARAFQPELAAGPEHARAHHRGGR